VYRIRFEGSRFQALAYDLPNPDMRLWHFGGQSKADSWIPQPVFIDRPRAEPPDIWHLFGAAVLVMSRETIVNLEPFVSAAGELLPLIVSGWNERLFALNILEDIDCIEPSAYSLDDLELYPHFIEHRLPESGLFKIPQTDTVDIFCLDRDEDLDTFPGRIQAHGLRGIAFQRIWSTAEGPEAVNLLRT
jgi:hypothetical protein